jgi:biotin transporter BioY
VDFYLMTAIFPWFAMARGGISIFAHAMFGLVLGWTYHAMAKPDRQDERSGATAI